ncbi:Receptor-type tyrosine-protein phosphatase C [Myotis brandtii]|uniref:Receptor-type tyrosine-protein phosphatase C n=1 Tax=Myotis brandtii TaxID=109478 RepID=S7NP05_MYOBR|nr:Receptor-type tyrosine-protein phosphatase C [Myotis brandtii]
MDLWLKLLALACVCLDIGVVRQGEKFANIINVTYQYDNHNKTFHAIVDVKCQPPQTCGNKRFNGLRECQKTNVTISDDSCAAPSKTLELHVPPGKYPSITPRLLAKTVRFPVWSLPGSTGQRGRTLAGRQRVDVLLP